MRRILIGSVICALAVTSSSWAGFRYDLRFADGSKVKPAEAGTYWLDAIAIVWGRNNTPADDAISLGRINLFSQQMDGGAFTAGGVISAERYAQYSQSTASLGEKPIGLSLPKYSDDLIDDWGTSAPFIGYGGFEPHNAIRHTLHYRAPMSGGLFMGPNVVGGGASGSPSNLILGAWEFPVARFKVEFGSSDLNVDSSSGQTFFRLRGNNRANFALQSNAVWYEDGLIVTSQAYRESGSYIDSAYVSFVGQSAVAAVPPLPRESNPYIVFAHEPRGPLLGQLEPRNLVVDLDDSVYGHVGFSGFFDLDSLSGCQLLVDLSGELDSANIAAQLGIGFVEINRTGYLEEGYDLSLDLTQVLKPWVEWDFHDSGLSINRLKVVIPGYSLPPGSAIPEPCLARGLLVSIAFLARTRGRVA